MTVGAPLFLPMTAYYLNLLMQASTYGVAVLGLTVVLGYTGQINLAQAAFFGLGSYSVALGTVSFGLPFWSALLVGVVIASIAGVVLGLTSLRLGGHYLAMVTISFQQILTLVLTNWISPNPRTGRYPGSCTSDCVRFLVCRGWYLPRRLRWGALGSWLMCRATQAQQARPRHASGKG
jgi:ABC-type branched-subunit amino acid transport system permease subunit